MIISIASGKGGTGKTTFAVNLALSLKDNVQLIDCDVEEPNAHIFLKPKLDKKENVYISVPKIDEAKCTFCGKCSEVCAYNAIAVLDKKVLTFTNLCHGCGGCMLLCPEKAISEDKRLIGVVEKGNAGNIEFIHGRLKIGEAMAPPLIRQVKNYINKEKTVIIDAPVGTSCPVIETIKKSDFCLLVTEPTPFGLNDLILAVEVLRKLKIEFAVAVNRSDIGDGRLEQYCEKENIPILMKIPFKREIAVAYSEGYPIIDSLPEYKNEFVNLHKKILEIIK